MAMIAVRQADYLELIRAFARAIDMAAAGAIRNGQMAPDDRDALAHFRAVLQRNRID